MVNLGALPHLTKPIAVGRGHNWSSSITQQGPGRVGGTTQTLFYVLQFLYPKTAAPTPGRGAPGLSRHLPSPLLLPLEEVAPGLYLNTKR